MNSFFKHCQTGNVTRLREIVADAPGGPNGMLVRKAIIGRDYAVLRFAASNGHAEVVLFLIELYGGGVGGHPRTLRAVSAKAHDAFRLACRSGHAGVLCALVTHAYGGYCTPLLREALVKHGCLSVALENLESLKAICGLAAAAAATKTGIVADLVSLLHMVHARVNTDVTTKAMASPEVWSTGVARALTTPIFRAQRTKPIHDALVQMPPAICDAMRAYFTKKPWELYTAP